jgi:OmcA/MtrC family decaheme c-type cytochrome
MPVCVLCHTPQTIDPDTGNTVDMAVMIHKIHRGEDLPSVTAGTPYVIIGNSQSVHDFSDVVFPAVDTRNCTFCHEQTTGAAQATAYLMPTMAACNSCHDDVNFDTGENHANLVQTSSEHCSECHLPEGEAEFDLSVTGAHTIPRFSSELPGATFNLISVTGAAGQPPTVVFKITDKANNPILPSQMTRLSLIYAGPTTDYPSSTREDATKATAAADGTATYTFKAAIPAGSKGSFGMGIEGYRNITIAAGTDHQQTVRDAGVNKVAYFSVDGSAVKPRRTVAATANCNKCHASLSLHGGNRNQIEQCVLCHNPNATDVAQRPASELPAQGIDLVTMIHRIHTGENLGFDYTIYGNGGSAHPFSDVLFPGDRRNCTACHVNNSQRLPVSAGHLDVTDPRGYLNPEGPETAACTSCHTAIFAASHALVNTSRLGESCAACHGTNSDFSVDRVHAH